MFKSQLQEYAQKAGWTAPVYDITREGPFHEPKFKAVVTIHDETFESPAFYNNLKRAEHAAAEVALEAFASRAELKTVVANPLHESGLCKNLLQEYAQKCKLSIPVYTIVRTGANHSPLFTAMVKIDGIIYRGGLSKNKKEAEVRAAKTALLAICAERGGTPNQAFDKQLASVGEEVPPPVAVASPPSTGVKRKKGKYSNQQKRRKKFLGNHKVERPAKTDEAQPSGTPDQTFGNQLASVGDEVALPVVVASPPSAGVKQKKGKYFHKKRKGKKFRGNQNAERSAKTGEAQPGEVVSEHTSGPMAGSMEIPGFTLLAA